MKQRTWLYLMIDGKYRCWEDFEKFGFLSAGHNSPASEPLQSMKTGDFVYAYASPRGYFACGKVRAPAVRPREFVVDGPFVHLQDGSPAGDRLPIDKLHTKRLYLRNDQDTDLSEFLVRVDWEIIFPRRKAKIAAGIQIPQSAVTELDDETTAEFLSDAFPRKTA